MANGKVRNFAKQDGIYECICGRKRYFLSRQYYTTCQCLRNHWLLKSSYKFDSSNSVIAHFPGGLEAFVEVSDVPEEGSDLPLESCFEEDSDNGHYSVAVLDTKRFNDDEFFYVILNYLGPLEPIHEKHNFYPVFNQ